MSLNVLQLLAVALPGLTSLLALTLPGVLKNDRFPAWLNGLLAFLAVGVFALVTLVAGGKLTGNFSADWVLLVAAFSSALAGPLRPLDAFLQSAVRIPLLHPPAQVTALMQSVQAGGMTSKAAPQPIRLSKPDQGG